MTFHVTLRSEQVGTLTLTVAASAYPDSMRIAEAMANDPQSEHSRYAPWVAVTSDRAS